VGGDRGGWGGGGWGGGKGGAASWGGGTWRCGVPAKYMDLDNLSIPELRDLKSMSHTTHNGERHNDLTGINKKLFSCINVVMTLAESEGVSDHQEGSDGIVAKCANSQI